MKEFQKLLDKNGYKITTVMKRDIEYYFAEAYHQQHLYKNPNGYQARWNWYKVLIK